jgi:hypothetical protein
VLFNIGVKYEQEQATGKIQKDCRIEPEDRCIQYLFINGVLYNIKKGK